MVRQAGVEPATHRFVVCYSIQLSYWRVPTVCAGLTCLITEPCNVNHLLEFPVAVHSLLVTSR
jgi:hypothetical protein